MNGCHVAQLNIAAAKHPLDSPRMADFMNNLDTVNAIADDAPGFVWRLQDLDGNATGIDFFGGNIIVNMSVWTSIDALHDFVYRAAHAKFMARRKEWFEHMDDAYTVLWWIRAGTTPTLEEARSRLERLRRHGPGPGAFTFKQRYEPPAGICRDAAPDSGEIRSTVTRG